MVKYISGGNGCQMRFTCQLLLLTWCYGSCIIIAIWRCCNLQPLQPMAALLSNDVCVGVCVWGGGGGGVCVCGGGGDACVCAYVCVFLLADILLSCLVCFGSCAPSTHNLQNLVRRRFFTRRFHFFHKSSQTTIKTNLLCTNCHIH